MTVIVTAKVTRAAWYLLLIFKVLLELKQRRSWLGHGSAEDVTRHLVSLAISRSLSD